MSQINDPLAWIDYAVRIRYPGEIPSLEDAQEAIKIAGDVRRFVRKFLGII